MRAAIESASRLALDANSETFLKLAREVFGRDQAAAKATLKEREVAIAQLVEPIKESRWRKQEEQAQASCASGANRRQDSPARSKAS